MDAAGHAPAPAGGGGRGRFLRALAWTAGALVALALLGFFAVPPLVRHLLVAKLGEALHRPVSVREVRFNPLQLTLSVRGVAVAERDGAGEFFGFDELFADLEASSIVRRAPVLREIRLSGPRVHVVRREDGRSYNFSDLLPGAGGGASAGAEKQPAGTGPDRKEPARFALHNIRVSGGRVDFEDRPRAARHAVAAIELTVPFVSNLPARVDVFEQPSLSAVVNGSPFRLSGKTKPFKDTLETVVDLDLQGIDVPRYLAYLPGELGFTLRECVLGVKLSASFSASPAGRALVVRGSARADRVAIAAAGGAPLLSLASLELPGFAVDVFKRRVDVDKVLLTAPEATLEREEKGGLNWVTALRFPESAPAEPEAAPWAIFVGEVRLAGGRVHWRDRAAAGGFTAELEGVEAGVRGFALPQSAPAQIDVKLRTGFGESLALTGGLLIAPLQWEGRVELAGVRPRAWEAYYRDALAQQIRDGVLDAAAAVKLAVRDGRTDLAVSGIEAKLAGLKVRQRAEPADFFELAALEVSGAGLDLAGRRVSLGAVTLRKARLGLVRDATGRVAPGVPGDAEAALAGEGASAGAPVQAPAAPAAAPEPAPVAAEPPWLLEAASVRLEDGNASLLDASLPERPTHTLGRVFGELTGLSTKPGSRAAVAVSLAINGTGKLSANGEIGLSPPAARVAVELTNLSIVPWYPYFADQVNFVTSSGALAAKGTIEVAPRGDGRAVSFRGEAALADFVAVDRVNAEEMLTWKSLALGGIALEAAPFALQIAEVVLSDFYSRLIIFPDGRMNVQQAVAGSPEAAPAATPAAMPAAPEQPKGPGQPEQPSPATDGAGAAVAIARVTLQGGTVSFSDRFIKPNYSATLTDLAGSVAGLSSKAGTTADLDVRGRLDRSAPLAISGKINPLAGNLLLDVKASVTDIELGTFTPYSGKYLGYGIEKGKLSFDVAYKIENRTLSAHNRLVLDQLTFGPKIESPDATSLPVQLAVALLKDRHGVIDVNLPIGGSLDDPQFSVGRIVLQIILNIIVKAVTSPFALIGSLFGGGEELSFAPFEAGGAALAPEGLKRVEALRKALIERPGLRLEIAGTADPELDRESLRRRRFEQQLKAQKLKDLARKGTAAPSLDAVVVEPAEYEKYLRRAYRDTKFPRPRNFLGVLKELPAAETENLLLTNTLVTDDDLAELANRRAQAAKDVLTAGDGVAPGRIFLLAPLVQAAGASGGRPPARAEFTLK